MSGIQMMLLGSGGGGPQSFTTNTVVTGLLGSSHTGYIYTRDDGTTGGTGGSGSNWYSQTTTGASAPYYIKYTLTSGPAWSSAQVAGTVYSLSGGSTLYWTVPSRQAKIGTVTASIYYDAAGTQLACTGTLNFDVESNN